MPGKGWPKKVLIVGGGTAGWLSAAYLDRSFNAGGERRLEIIVVESPAVGRIGVGEATIPGLLPLLEHLGLGEAELMRRTSATLKHCVRFEDWAEPGHVFHHPFEAFGNAGGEDPALAWLARRAAGVASPFDHEAGIQSALAEAGRSPKRIGDADYRGPLAYAYHLDAEAFGDVLCDLACERGVRRVLDEVTEVTLSQGGEIAAVRCRESGDHTADLFIDCTGFASILLGGALGTHFHSYAGQLLCDRAVAIQQPFLEESPAIPPYTLSRALTAGWMWRIGLRSRMGNGYVYSAAHLSPEDAERELRAAIAADPALPARHIRMRVGRSSATWVKNCVAIGLSGGFVEPLESTGIHLIGRALELLKHYFPLSGHNPTAVGRFNDQIAREFDEIRDFIVAHYCFNRREERFWADARRESTFSESLAELLAVWRERPPSAEHFSSRPLFGPASYQFILYGMDWTPPGLLANARALGCGNPRVRDRVAQALRRAMDDLPAHRQWLDSIA